LATQTKNSLQSRRVGTNGAQAEFTQRTLIVIGLVLLGALLAAIVVLAVDVLLVLFGGVLFAVFLRGLAEPLSEHTRLSPNAALILVLVTLALIAGVGTWFLASEIAAQLGKLGTDLGDLWAQFQARLEQTPWGRQLLNTMQNAQSGGGGDLAARAALVFSTTLGAVANLFIVVFVGVYVALNPGWYRRGVLRLAPPRHRAHTGSLLDSIGHTLRWWLLGRAVGMAVVGATVTLGLWLMGVPLALALGAIAALLDFVPIIGPIIAAAPAVLVALSEGPAFAAQVAGLYLAIQLLEGYVLTPLIEQRSVALAPALTIGAQVILGVLTGAVGVVLATPLTAVVVVLVRRLYVEDALEHRGSGAMSGSH
jgi:predicted PurR-regulated permease PerM